MTEQFEHGYGLIVGVDDNNIKRLALPDVAKDVQAVYDVLTHPQRCAYLPDNVRFIKGSESTKQNIMDGLFWLSEKVANDANATAIIYYSGHGMEDKATDKYYLIPYDIRAMSRIRADAIPADSFNGEISALTPRRLLVILDCCHAAGMKVKDIDLDAIDAGDNAVAKSFPVDLSAMGEIPEFVDGAKDVLDLLDGEGRAVLNSSTGSQSSYVRPDGKMSVFTYHLIESLTGHGAHEEGDTTIDVAEMMSYVTRHVKRTAKEMGLDQTPVMRTTGVFPVAQLLGGTPFAKGVTELPDPLEPLSEKARNLQQITVGDGGVAAVGDGATAVGERGVNVGGNVGGSINTGDTNITQGGVNFGGSGNVHIGGDIAGRDLIKRGDTVQGDKIQVGNISGRGIAIGSGASSTVNEGDTFNMSGDFRGAMVNVKSTLNNVQQTIGGMPNANDNEKAALEGLVKQLEEALTKVPASNIENAEAISQMTEALVEQAAKDEPNKTILQFSGEGLKAAARNLAEIAPDVQTIAGNIIAIVNSIAGIP